MSNDFRRIVSRYQRQGGKPGSVFLSRRALRFTLWTLVLSGVLNPWASAGEAVIDIGDRKQLFIDDKFIASSDNVTLTMNPPHQTGEILLTPDEPHEEGGYTGLYASVMKEGGMVRLWYDLITPFGPNPHDHHRDIRYAESANGLDFNKPIIGLHEVDGSTENNVVVPGRIGGGAVWVDPQASPEHRYKTQAKFYTTPGTAAGVFLIHSSPDGLRWEEYAEIDTRGHTDTQTVIFWDPRVNRYAFYGRDKEYVEVGGERTSIRMVRRQESDDLEAWDTQSRILEPDAIDRATYDMGSELPPVDYYGATVFRYPGGGNPDSVYIMLAQAFWHFTDRGYGGAIGPYTRDVRLLVSRDGEHFERAGERRPFMGPGPVGRFDSKEVWALPNPVRMDDELWIYYVGTNQDRTSRPSEERIDPGASDGERLSAISRAVMRLDGFVSADAPYEGGELVTPLLRFDGARLELNVDTAAGGSVRVELLSADGEPIPGFTQAEATPVNGNSVRMPVRWVGGGDVSQLADTPIRLRFVMRDCKLYAFQFRE